MIAQKKENQYQAYKNTEISTADQKKLILMLYDGALRFLQTAIENMQPTRYDVVNNNIIKSQDIITELMISLDMKAGGEISTNLFNIYAYLKKRLLEANIAKDASILEEVSRLLSQLREAWAQVSEKDEKKVEDRPSKLGLSIQG